MSFGQHLKNVWEQAVGRCYRYLHIKETQDETVWPDQFVKSENPPQPPSDTVVNKSSQVKQSGYQRHRHSQIPKPGPIVKATPVSAASADEDPEGVEKIGDAWIVQGVDSFMNKAVYTFSRNTLPKGLYASNYVVQNTARGSPSVPYNQRFVPANVQVRSGFVRLKVPGGQRPNQHPNKEISCAELATKQKNILYASVRTNAIFSRVPGTCHGLFFYANDNQETDIEYLTDPSSRSNNGPDELIPMWYSNQAVDPVEGEASQETGPAPFDCTSRVHEYRIDWTPDFTAFYIDGTVQKQFTNNIPSMPGPWLWNNWANGNKGWCAGPPKVDNILKIESILMYYNTSSLGRGV